MNCEVFASSFSSDPEIFSMAPGKTYHCFSYQSILYHVDKKDICCLFRCQKTHRSPFKNDRHF